MLVPLTPEAGELCGLTNEPASSDFRTVTGAQNQPHICMMADSSLFEHSSSSAIGTHSRGLCAVSIDPGPITTASAPIFVIHGASVPNEMFRISVFDCARTA